MDKRKHERFIVVTKVDVMDITAETVNISEGGMQIRSEYLFKEKHNIPFCIFLPDLELIRVTGDVVWTDRMNGEIFVSGVKFTEISEENKLRLRTLFQAEEEINE